MSKKKPVYVIGDVHGKWERIIDAVPDLNHGKYIGAKLIQVGDFGVGFYSERKEGDRLDELNQALAENHVDLWVVRGNHDDPSYFTDNRIRSHIRLLKDYTVEEIGSMTYLFVGGAISIDRYGRIDGRDWWEDEGIRRLSREEWDGFAGTFDVVVTHTAPPVAPPTLRETSMPVVMASIKDNKLLQDVRHENQVMQELCNRVNEFKSPSHWYYGHFHESANVKVDDTHYYLLDINEIKRVPEKTV